MSKLFSTYTAMALCSVCLISCQDELLTRYAGSGNVEIVASMDGGISTRTCVDGATPDGTTGILWSPGDRIGVYGDGSTRNALFSSTNTGAVAEAVFTGNLPSGENPAYAYYPYSEDNALADLSAIQGDLKLEQAFDTGTGTLEADYKVGTPKSTSTGGRQYEFSFVHLFSLLKFDIDATGSALEDDRLESIILTLPDGRRLGGRFTFNAETREVTWNDASTDGANKLTMNWSDMPALAAGSQYTGYVTCAADIHAGDEIKVTILTNKFEAEFTRTALSDFEANTCYTFPLSLANYKDMTVTERPVITAFSFDVVNNGGKILDKKLVYANGATRPADNVKEVLTIGTDSITGCIPYLYDFKLKPTFTVPDGMTVTVDGVEQTSGVTEQDFSRPITYTVSNGTDSRTYVVEVTNSGLPVVVLEHEGGSVVWDEAGLNVCGKNEDWGKNDRFTLYNADGTVDVAGQCGARLRGNSTQNFPKLPFALKFDNKVGMQGLPKDKRWELLANWMDRTMLRNAAALEVAHRTADAYTDGLGWNPHGFNVELVINGRHVGNYFLCEKVKIGGDRVDIKDCYEDVVDDGNSNPSVADCGYLLEFDDAMDENCKFRTGRGLPVMFKDDVPDNLLEAVKSKVGQIEADLEAGKYSEAYGQLDINSVIDYFFIQELTFNNEYKHPKSVYMYIDGDGPLTAGPVWDFDWQTFIIPDNVRPYGGAYLNQLRNADEWLYGASKLAERKFPLFGEYDYENDMPYMWYPLLFKDATFRSKVQERWIVIYSALSSVVDEIDRLAKANRLSDKYNSAMWPTTQQLKNECGAAFNGDEDMTFDEAISSMKKAYTDRLAWMNTQITSGNFVTDAE